jgi:hypothetical protein
MKRSADKPTPSSPLILQDDFAEPPSKKVKGDLIQNHASSPHQAEFSKIKCIDRTPFFERYITTCKEQKCEAEMYFAYDEVKLGLMEQHIARIEALHKQYLGHKTLVHNYKPKYTFQDLPMDTVLLILDFIQIQLGRYWTYKKEGRLNDNFYMRLYFGYFVEDPIRTVRMIFPNIAIHFPSGDSIFSFEQIPSLIKSIELQNGSPQFNAKPSKKFPNLTSLSLTDLICAGNSLKNLIENSPNLRRLSLFKLHERITDLSNLYAATKLSIQYLCTPPKPSLSDESWKFYVQRFPNLREFKCSEARNVSPATLLETLPLLQNLTCINIPSLRLSETSDTKTKLFSTTLRDLTLSGFYAPNKALMSSICTELPKLKALTLLFEVTDSREWMEDLAACTSLEKLGIQSLLSQTDAKELALNTSITNLTVQVSADSFESLFKDTRIATNLRKLSLSGAVSPLFNVLASYCTNLEHFSLANVKLTLTSITTICNGLRNLKVLNLESCSINDEMATELFLNTNLTSLELSGNHIENVSAMSLNWTLTYLDLSCNKLQNRDLKVLFTENDTLVTLKLEGNDDINAKGLRYALDNRTLAELTIGSRHFNVTNVVDEIVNKCTNIQCFSVK